MAYGYAEECWSMLSFLGKVYTWIDMWESFVEFLFFVLSLKGNDVSLNIAMILWKLWKDMNDDVWSNKMPSLIICICLATNASSEWRKTWWIITLACQGWHDLPQVSVFTRCCFFHSLNRTGTDMVLHDERGGFVAPRRIIIHGYLHVDEG